MGLSNGKGALGALALVAAGVCGLAASAYGIATAYFMGSRAQASVDGNAPATPVVLLNASLGELRAMVGATARRDDPITTEVEVVDAPAASGGAGE